MRKYCYLYQITNKINGKIYVGVHSTDDLNDGYMGSGSLLKKAFAKYGMEAFEKLILKQFSSEQEMYLEEASIVTAEFIEREDTYNLKEGGEGGTTPCQEVKDKIKLAHQNLQRKSMGWYSIESQNKIKAYQQSEKGKSDRKKAVLKATQPEAIRKRNESQGYKHKRGTKNTIWITDGQQNRMLKIEEEIPEGFRIGMTRSVKNSKIHYGKETNNFGKTWYTNGVENKFLKPDESIPEGFYKGRVISKSKK